MDRVGPIPHEGAVARVPGQLASPSCPRPPAAQPADRVELSEAARSSTTESDAARIAEIRARIADETYLTPEKLEVAIEGSLRDALRER
jgi:hypothetical protein